MKGRSRLKISQISIILMYEVLGRLLDMLITMVVRTNMQVRFTVTTASKKMGLKKFVAWPIKFKRSVGK